MNNLIYLNHLLKIEKRLVMDLITMIIFIMNLIFLQFVESLVIKEFLMIIPNLSYLNVLTIIIQVKFNYFYQI